MEKLLQFILPSFVGDFIQGIDRETLKANFLKGKVSLKDISLNPSMLSKLGAPFRIVYSNIGNLEMNIPWLKGFKQPIELCLEDFLVLIEPNEDIKEVDIVEEKMKLLDRVTEFVSINPNEASKPEKKSEGLFTYYKLLILDNIQVASLYFLKILRSGLRIFT
jgi:Vacuolar protein sorting-associated protein